MINNNEKSYLLLEAEEIIEQRKIKAEAEVLKHEETLDKTPEYVEIWNKKGALTIEIAEKLYAGEDVNNLMQKLEETKKQLEEVALKYGITKEMLKPNYTCKTCNDTGYVNGEQCHCLKQVYGDLLLSESNINLEDFCKIEDLDKNFYGGASAKKLVGLLQEIANKYDITKINNIIINGKCGVGKTYVMKSFAKSMLEKNKTVLYLTAFNLNNLFLEMLVGGFETKMKILKQLLDVDLLLIDDLGTEPIYKNVTIENLYTIIDERLNRNKKIMITTNMLPEQIKDRYDLRIYGRLYQKDKSLSAIFDGENLREKN